MNVALSTDGGRVAEATGDGLKGAAQIGFCLGLVPERSNGAKSHGRKHRARPGAKILGGPVRTSNFAQISVQVRGVDGATKACLVDVLEEVLPGKILDCPHDAGDAAVFHSQPPGFPAFALEVKRNSELSTSRWVEWSVVKP